MEQRNFFGKIVATASKRPRVKTTEAAMQFISRLSFLSLVNQITGLN